MTDTAETLSAVIRERAAFDARIDALRMYGSRCKTIAGAF